MHMNHLIHMAACQKLVPLVNIKIAGKWMFIPLKMVLIGIDPYPYGFFHKRTKHALVFATGSSLDGLTSLWVQTLEANSPIKDAPFFAVGEIPIKSPSNRPKIPIKSPKITILSPKITSLSIGTQDF